MHYQIRSNTNIRRLHRLFVMEAALRRRRLRRSMSIRLRCAVSKRVILNCLITWSTRCALPHGSPPAICPHGTWELGGGMAAPRVPTSAPDANLEAGGNHRSVVRRLLRVWTTAGRFGVCILAGFKSRVGNSLLSIYAVTVFSKLRPSSPMGIGKCQPPTKSIPLNRSTKKSAQFIMSARGPDPLYQTWYKSTH